jgi:hypothetical protein
LPNIRIEYCGMLNPELLCSMLWGCQVLSPPASREAAPAIAVPTEKE